MRCTNRFATPAASGRRCCAFAPGDQVQRVLRVGQHPDRPRPAHIEANQGRRARAGRLRPGTGSGRRAPHQGCPGSSTSRWSPDPTLRGGTTPRAGPAPRPHRRSRGRGRSRAAPPGPAARPGPARSGPGSRPPAGPRTPPPPGTGRGSPARSTGPATPAPPTPGPGPRAGAAGGPAPRRRRGAAWPPPHPIPRAAPSSAGANSATHGAPTPANGHTLSPCRSSWPQCAGISSAGHGCNRAHTSARASSSAPAANAASRARRTRTITSAGEHPEAVAGAMTDVVSMAPILGSSTDTIEWVFDICGQLLQASSARVRPAGATSLWSRTWLESSNAGFCGEG